MRFSSSSTGVPPAQPSQVSPGRFRGTVRSGPTASRNQERKSWPPRLPSQPPSAAGGSLRPGSCSLSGWEQLPGLAGRGGLLTTVFVTPDRETQFSPQWAGGASWPWAAILSAHRAHISAPALVQAGRPAHGHPQAALLPCDVSLTSEDKVLKQSISVTGRLFNWGETEGVHSLRRGLS